MNPNRDVLILRPNQRIAKEQGMFGKTLIVDIAAETTDIFYQEYGGCAGISLAESVNLPNAVPWDATILTQLPTGVIAPRRLCTITNINCTQSAEYVE